MEIKKIAAHYRQYLARMIKQSTRADYTKRLEMLVCYASSTDQITNLPTLFPLIFLHLNLLNLLCQIINRTVVKRIAKNAHHQQRKEILIAPFTLAIKPFTKRIQVYFHPCPLSAE